VADLPRADAEALAKLREAYFRGHEENLRQVALGQPSERVTIFITQYDPSTYHDDLKR
jgi:hypothetical protein